MTCLTLVRLFLWENFFKLGWVLRSKKIHRLNMVQHRQYFENMRQYFDDVLFFSAFEPFEEYWWSYGAECFPILRLLREGWHRSFQSLFIIYASSIISSSEKTLKNKIWWLLAVCFLFEVHYVYHGNFGNSCEYTQILSKRKNNTLKLKSSCNLITSIILT